VFWIEGNCNGAVYDDQRKRGRMRRWEDGGFYRLGVFTMNQNPVNENGIMRYVLDF
jgi:hypothetical protein